MPYIYENAEKLIGEDTVDTKQCVALIQHYTKAPHTMLWRKGDEVKGNITLKTGTAIATFVDGKYKNHSHGNHAAFYVGQNSAGIWVVDQWSGLKTINKRLLRYKGVDKTGHYVTPSNNGDAFSVIQ